MEKPFWFRLIEQWVLTRRGEYGITFPFLIGAVSIESGKTPNRELIENVFRSIIENPFTGYYRQVRWCGNIGEPVTSVRKLSEIHKVSIKSLFKAQNRDVATLAFTTDLMSMFNLNCTNESECLDKLTSYTENHVLVGSYSKNQGQFTPFTEDDFEFITSVKAQ